MADILFPKKYLDAAGAPRSHSTSEEIVVFCPDWTANRQCCGENRPVFWVTLAQSFTGDSFEPTVNLASNQLFKPHQGVQKCKRLFRIATTFHDKFRQMFFGFGKRGSGD